MRRCIRCRSLGIRTTGDIKLGRQWFCKECFQEHLIKKVNETIDRYELIHRDDTVYIGVSGGKDSAALCSILSKIASRRGYFKVKAFHINLGFSRYSKVCEETVSKLTEHCGVELDVFVPEVKVKRYGQREVCSVCGAIKRYTMNKYVRENGGTVIATAHTLDDQVLFLLKNFVSWQPQYLIKQYPYLPGNKEMKMLPRIRPLFYVDERELKKYVEIANIPVVAMDCPYKDIKRKLRKDAIDHLDTTLYKFKLLLIKNFIKNVLPLIKEKHKYPGKLMRCKFCGEPTSTEVCLHCRLKAQKN